MSYRQKSHPDVVITIKSSSAREHSEEKQYGYNANKTILNDFWGIYAHYIKSYKSVWSYPGMGEKKIHSHTVKLGGNKGFATFVGVEPIESKPPDYLYDILKKMNVTPPPEETNKDLGTDYVYFAVATGNKENPEKEPDIELLVEQHRKDAIKKNIVPMTKEEVLKLAETIAASIKIRAVK